MRQEPLLQGCGRNASTWIEQTVRRCGPRSIHHPPKVADSDLHRDRLSRGGPNSVLGPPNQRDGPLAPPSGALTKGAPKRTAWIRGSSQQRGGPRSSRPSRRWPTQICTGAACPDAAQTVSWGRVTEVAALSRRWRAPSRKGRPRRRPACAALPSRAACRDPAGLPEAGRLTG